MLGLGVLLLVQAASGSLGEAGAVAGALSVGNAAGVALQGRLIDRRGQAPVIVPAGLLCAVALGLLVLAALRGGPAALLALLALAAGAGIPATTSSMRVLVPALLSDTATLPAAYALLAIAIAHGAPSLSGLLLALAAVGDLAGGLAYGCLPWRPSASGRLHLAQAGSATVAACMAVAASPLTLVPLMLLGGAVAAPAAIA